MQFAGLLVGASVIDVAVVRSFWCGRCVNCTCSVYGLLRKAVRGPSNVALQIARAIGKLRLLAEKRPELDAQKDAQGARKQHRNVADFHPDEVTAIAAAGLNIASLHLVRTHSVHGRVVRPPASRRRDAVRGFDAACLATIQGATEPCIVHYFLRDENQEVWAVVEPLQVASPYWKLFDVDDARWRQALQSPLFMRHVMQVGRSDARVCLRAAALQEKVMLLQGAEEREFVAQFPNFVEEF